VAHYILLHFQHVIPHTNLLHQQTSACSHRDAHFPSPISLSPQKQETSQVPIDFVRNAIITITLRPSILEARGPLNADLSDIGIPDGAKPPLADIHPVRIGGDLRGTLWRAFAGRGIAYVEPPVARFQGLEILFCAVSGWGFYEGS